MAEMPADSCDRPFPGLSSKQQRFVDAYEGNATAAGPAVGYSGPYARRLIKDERIARAISVRVARERVAGSADRTDRKLFWSAVMRDPIVHMSLRLKASELLARAEGDFRETADALPPFSIQVEIPPLPGDDAGD